VTVPADYDAIADWYEEWVRGAAVGFTARAGEALRRVLGPGRGVCWDVACGTGVHADTLRDLGWTVVGSDVSAGQLRHAAPRLPVFLADARTPPVRPGSADAAVAVLCHTDIEDYAGVCAAAAAAVRPGGRFAHVGIHPCFSGAFVDRSDPGRLVTTPGYWRRERRWSGWSAAGVRERVGAVHVPLSELIEAMVAAGLVLDSVCEVGEPTPDVLALGAHRPRRA